MEVWGVIHSPIILQCVSPVMAHNVNSDSYLEWSLSEA
jgi:hypothetical protein